MEVKIDTIDLKPGMFVSRLERPWIETDFPLQGVLIRDQQDIERVARWSSQVWVDTERGRDPLEETSVSHGPPSGTDPDLKRRLTGRKPIDHDRSRVAFEDERDNARHIYQDLRRQLPELFRSIAEERRIDLDSARKLVDPMVDSVLRNPDALGWLAQLRSSDEYTWHHAIGSAIWAAAMGRHLGLPRNEILQLSLGCLLLDIGKLRLPRALLKKPGPLTAEETEQVHRHVGYGLEMLQASSDIGPLITQMVATHHERHDGSGYPHGLAGSAIPLHGRIAGLVDSYDALISERPYAQARSPYDAIQTLYGWRGSAFQTEVVELFIQAMGSFPAGTLVELHNGQVGIVVEQHAGRRLRPRLMMLMDTEHRLLGNFHVIDLADIDDRTAREEGWRIRTALPPGSYGLDPAELFL